MLTRRLLGVWLLLLVAAVSRAQIQVSRTDSPQNLLVVLVDDLGTDYLGCYQQNPAAPATPNIDALALQGVRFDSAYANPVCTPTRACLMTGRHAFRNSLELTCTPGDPGLRDEEWTLPEAITTSGYAQAFIGKWHLGDRHGSRTPNVHGWQHFAGALYGNIPNYTQWTKIVNGATVHVTTYATTDQVNDALSWIGSQRRPWLMFLSLYAPHTPLHTPPAHLHRQNLAGLQPSTSPIPFYKAMIEAIDTEIGRLLSGLGSARARTNVILLSDNGTPSATALAPYTKAKGSLYEGGVRIPLIIQGPAVVRPGRAVSDRVHAVDLFPTLLELAGGPHKQVPPPMDGRSFASILADRQNPPRSIYSETIGTGFGSGYTRIDGDYKLIRFTDDPVMMPHEELYNVRLDPRETNDLLAPGATTTAADRAAYQTLSDGLWELRSRGYIVAFGNDCPTSAGSVRLKSYAPPSIGIPHFLRVLSPGVGTNAQTFGAFVYFGFGPGSWDDPSLPQSLDYIGMPGCTQYSRQDTLVYAGPTDTLFWVRMPNDPAMLGTVAAAQAFVSEPGLNPAGLAVSAGYRMTLGVW